MENVNFLNHYLLLITHYSTSSQILTLWVASIVDYFVGDPWGLPHPVQFIGKVIDQWVKLTLTYFTTPIVRKIWGVVIGLTLIIGSGVLSWLLIYVASGINPYGSFFLQVVLLASCFAGRSLRNAMEDVLNYLRCNDVENARYRLRFYVGRDTDNLTITDIYRGLLETLSENTTDGVTAPLFYAILGAFFPVIGSVPLAMAYKTASTLDSMIGYKKEPFTDIGWFSAKLEDYLTWIPCRLTVLTLAVIAGKPWQKIRECRVYAIQDSSPNSGWSEAIYAIILRVQLGGINYYQGEKKIKPLLGKPLKPIDEDVINQSLLLTRSCFLLWLFIASVMLLIRLK